jgi:simple sugar transport system permease protein
MALPVAAWFYLHRTRPGLALLASGENPETAQAMGIPVRRLRYVHVAAGGAFAGLAGASLSLAITPGWVEGMTAGQGWIALGLVIFARWNPLYVALGALLFGVVRRLPLDLQGTDVAFFRDPNLGYFLNMLPYLVTVGVLVVSRVGGRAGTGQPAGLNRAVD